MSVVESTGLSVTQKPDPRKASAEDSLYFPDAHWEGRARVTYGQMGTPYRIPYWKMHRYFFMFET